MRLRILLSPNLERDVFRDYWLFLYPLVLEEHLDKILVLSNSPQNTPQNIADEFVRTSINEPSNLSHVVKRLAEVLEMPQPELSKKACFASSDPRTNLSQIWSNTLHFFGLEVTA